MSKITLYGRRGWGSAIVEAQLEWLGLDYTYQAVGDLLRSAEARRSLAPVNPLAQVPTLVLANGNVLTESAAICLGRCLYGLYTAGVTSRSCHMKRTSAATPTTVIQGLLSSGPG